MNIANETNVTRRDVFRASAAGAIALAGAAATTPRNVCAAATTLKHNATILLQGDSITDAGRKRDRQLANDIGSLGIGYANMIAAGMLGYHPTLALQCHNRGISGNKVPDLAARWDEDTLDLNPDVLSILIGVNDVWHTFDGKYDGNAEKYETGYTALLERTRSALPETMFVICEPFVLRCGVVKDSWLAEIEAHRAAAKRVADAAGATWVPFQSMFDNAITDDTPPEYWARDGVHPSMAGHALMARTWIDATGLAD